MMLNVPLLPSRHSVQFYLSVTLTHIFFDPLIANSVSARMLEAVFRLCWQTPLLGIAGKQPRHFHPHSPPLLAASSSSSLRSRKSLMIIIIILASCQELVYFRQPLSFSKRCLLPFWSSEQLRVSSGLFERQF